MLVDFKLLIEDLRRLQTPDEFTLYWDRVQEELSLVASEYSKLKFKYERSNKEKNILSSLLTRTSADLKKVSEHLKIRAEELSTILSTIPAYVYFKDIDLKYILVNQSFAELFGADTDQIHGKRIKEILPGYNNPGYFEQENKVINSGTAVYDIEEEIEFNGRLRWVSTNLAPIRNVEDQIIGLIGISWDITERKHYESELRYSKELAEAGTMAKNEFIASISHEFRTPMNGILGLAEILRTTALDENQMDHLKGIITSAENLLVLVNDLLDFSAIEAGKMELDFHPFMLDRVLEDIFQMLNLKAREKSLDFSVKIADAVPTHLVGDSQRLRQIIINLANNAVKFTDQGKIEIRISLENRSADRALLRFEVIDTGIGIPPEAKDSLFKVFSRIKQNQHKLIAGTGLGLSICKKLTDLLGGEIGVESMLGAGSTFWFILPFELSGIKVFDPFKTETFQELLYTGQKVLVAEDNLINQKIVCFQLRRMGFEVELADNGQSAYEKYTGGSFDVVVLDIQMPLMDGYQVAKAIRIKEQNTFKHIPIIALTANAMKGDRELYLAAGMDGYVSKPFTAETLQQAIQLAVAVASRYSRD
ncbi:MAG: ATP-binding protein [Bacteroidetes bacterium]|nr:ATP-binding protein [Bacteroidota bacterium]